MSYICIKCGEVYRDLGHHRSCRAVIAPMVATPLQVLLAIHVDQSSEHINRQYGGVRSDVSEARARLLTAGMIERVGRCWRMTDAGELAMAEVFT